MSTFTSSLPYSGAIPSSQPQKMRTPKHVRASLAVTRTNATAHLASKLESVSSSSAEKFYQDHVTAIFMGIYMETALAPLMGALGVYLYCHWMM